MLSLILGIVAGVCATKWFLWKLCATALVLVMVKRDAPPSQEETEAALKETWLRTLHIKKD